MIEHHCNVADPLRVILSMNSGSPGADVLTPCAVQLDGLDLLEHEIETLAGPPPPTGILPRRSGCADASISHVHGPKDAVEPLVIVPGPRYDLTTVCIDRLRTRPYTAPRRKFH